jgi:hypothetical protein
MVAQEQKAIMARKVKVAALILKIVAATGYVIIGHVQQISADESLRQK